jgi:hypothetical protein
MPLGSLDACWPNFDAPRLELVNEHQSAHGLTPRQLGGSTLGNGMLSLVDVYFISSVAIATQVQLAGFAILLPPASMVDHAQKGKRAG